MPSVAQNIAAKLNRMNRELLAAILKAYREQECAIGDSDLDREQPYSLNIRTTLGHLRDLRLFATAMGINEEQLELYPHQLRILDAVGGLGSRRLVNALDAKIPTDEYLAGIAARDLAACSHCGGTVGNHQDHCPNKPELK